MVGLSLTLSLAAILSTVILASPDGEDGSSPIFKPVTPIPDPSSSSAPQPAPLTTQSPHAIRERSALLTEDRPRYEHELPRGEDEEVEGEGVGVTEDQRDAADEENLDPDDPTAPRRRTVRNCNRAPFFFTRRSALDKNFMRFGRSGGGATGEESPGTPDDENKATDLMRLGRDRNFIRLGRSVGGSNNFIRLGRTPLSHVIEGELGESGEEEDKGRTMDIRGSLNNFMRFGRGSADRNFIRLGRSQGDHRTAESPVTEQQEPQREPQREPERVPDRERERNFERFSRDRLDRNFMRFGRGSGNNFMRFGRGPNNNFMRFGRSSNSTYMRFGRSPNNNFMRFGRGPSNNFMRFGRGANNNFMRFGRGAGNNFMRFGRDSGREEDMMNGDLQGLLQRGSDIETEEEEGLPRVYRRDLDRNFMRLGRSSNKNFIRFGRGAGNNFMRFGRGGEVEEEDDNGMNSGNEEFGQFNEDSEGKVSDPSEIDGLKVAFVGQSGDKTPGDIPMISSRSKRSVTDENSIDNTNSLDPLAEETLANPYGSPSMAASSPLSAYLFSPELLLMSSLGRDNQDEGQRYRRGGKSNFIRFG